MPEKPENRFAAEMFRSSHLLILLVYTVMSAGLTAAALLFSWELWALLIVLAGVISCWGLHLTQTFPAKVRIGIYSFLILLSGFDTQRRTYPTTHHETLVVAYAMAATGANVALSIAFGMLSNLIYLLFARYFNENCDTHIDPPAVAIEICSLILFTCF